MSSPPFMLTVKVFSDFSRALEKARRQRLNPSEIQEHYVSFWSSSDAKDNIWVDLRPFEGWGASEWGDRNYIITWEIVLLRCCSIYSNFLPSFCFLEQKINTQQQKTPPKPGLIYPLGKKKCYQDCHVK